MIDPLYIKIAALVGGALLLFGPSLPGLFEKLKGLVSSGKRSHDGPPTLVDATEALQLVSKYIDSTHDDDEVCDALHTIAVAMVERGLHT